MKDVILIGYSGHALVAADIIVVSGRKIAGYCDLQEKPENPMGIPYLGHELGAEALKQFLGKDYFVAIGDNQRRRQVVRSLHSVGVPDPLTIVHPSAVFASTALIGRGVMLAASSTINPFVTIEDGAVCNTGCTIEHECRIEEYAHIAPGAVLAGNVRVGARSFVGANAVVKEGVSIGNDCLVGAGAVIIRNIADGAKVVGNPGRIL